MPVENSLLFFEALHKAGVPGELHVFPHGRHGLGLAPGDPAVSQWPRLCAVWMEGLGLLKKDASPRHPEARFRPSPEGSAVSAAGRTVPDATCCVALLAVFSALAAPLSAATSGSGLPISDAVLQRQWTGSWIACPGAPERDPGVFRFRKSIDLPAVPPRFVVHVSADQRFVLHVNGRRVGIGPSRGDILFWRFETFDLAPFLKPGPNLVSAIVWNFGTQAPAAQITDRTGFVVQGDGDAERPRTPTPPGSARRNRATSRGPRA